MLRGACCLQKQYQATKLDFVVSSHLHIVSYDQNGFTLSNKIYHKGPIALYQGMVLNWKAESFNATHLALWQSLKPTVLLFGTGNNPLFLPKDIQSELFKFKIPFEAMSTKHAISTFGVLSSEDRKVALLCLPSSI